MVRRRFVREIAIEALMYGTRCRGTTQFYLHTHAFTHELSLRYQS